MNRISLLAAFFIVAFFLGTASPGQEKRKAVKESQSSQNISPVEKIKMAKALLDEAKRGLKREGKYNCCIDTPCNQCALDHQSCPCYDELKASKPVCPECYAGWQRGEGKDSSIKPSEVKTKLSTHRH